MVLCSLMWSSGMFLNADGFMNGIKSSTVNVYDFLVITSISE